MQTASGEDTVPRAFSYIQSDTVRTLMKRACVSLCRMVGGSVSNPVAYGSIIVQTMCLYGEKTICAGINCRVLNKKETGQSNFRTLILCRRVRLSGCVEWPLQLCYELAYPNSIAPYTRDNYHRIAHFRRVRSSAIATPDDPMRVSCSWTAPNCSILFGQISLRSIFQKLRNSQLCSTPFEA